jgi:RNA polymerase sigma-70 factor (sigma-E family)
VDAEQERQFRELVQARWTSLVRYAYLLTGDRGEAEDAVQAALERTLRHWTRIRDDRPEAYIRAAVTNGVISRRRWRMRRPAEAPLEDGASAEARPGVGDGADERAVRAVIWQELQSLPPRMRAVVVLRLWEDLPEAEVARLLGCSVGSVKSQLSRALVRLRARPELIALTHPPMSFAIVPSITPEES